MTLSPQLVQALRAHDCDRITDDQKHRLQQYCELLWSWNARLNLTRHTDYDQFVARDLHDTLQLLPHLSDSESVLDAGSGGGVPGLLLPILNPTLTVSVCDSTQKKAAALSAMCEQLQLPVTVFPQRVEQVVAEHAFDVVTARAVAPLKRLLPWFHPHQSQVGRLLLIKGPAWHQERDEAAAAGALRHVSMEPVAEYATSGRDGNSVVLQVRFAGPHSGI